MTEELHPIQIYLAQLAQTLGQEGEQLNEFVKENSHKVLAFVKYEGCEPTPEILVSKQHEIQQWLNFSDEELEAMLESKGIVIEDESGTAFEQNLLKSKNAKWLFYIVIFLLFARMLGKTVVTFSVIFLALYFFLVNSNNKEHGRKPA
jgi:hypothetical protein